MMAGVLNSAILDSDCHLGFRHLVIISQIHSKTLSLHSDSDWNKFKLTPTHSFSTNLMMAAIVNSAILNTAILHKKSFTYSFWLNLMVPAILNSAMLDSDTAIFDSDTLCSSLRFTQKHSLSTLTLTETNSNSLRLIHSQLTWWWQPLWILPSWIQPFCTKKASLIHFDWTWWCQPSWILPCWIQTLPSWIQTPCILLSDLLKNTLTPLWLWLKLIQSD